jgi:hypothetical protein
MPITITVETGAGVVGANSYASLAELKAFFEAHPYGAAVLAYDDEKLKAGLVQAGRMLDASADWRGGQVKWDQAMAWPRIGLWPGGLAGYLAPETLGTDRAPYDGGAPVPPDKVPPRIRDAQCELVRFVLASDRDADSDGAAIKREKLDVIEVEYQQGATKALVPEPIQRLVAAYVAVDRDSGAATSSAVMAVRG